MVNVVSLLESRTVKAKPLGLLVKDYLGWG